MITNIKHFKENFNQMKISGIRAYVYRNTLDDGSNNGVSSIYDDFIIVNENLEGNGPFESKLENNEDVLVIVEDTIMNKPRIRAIPYDIFISKQRSMFGGNFIYTSDSRFPGNTPIKIYDRIE